MGGVGMFKPSIGGVQILTGTSQASNVFRLLEKGMGYGLRLASSNANKSLRLNNER